MNFLERDVTEVEGLLQRAFDKLRPGEARQCVGQALTELGLLRRKVRHLENENNEMWHRLNPEPMGR